MVNLELYRVFYAVAKCGSLTKAAKELHISQSAVSQSIKQLESQLGCSLFNRLSRGMELSSQGGALIIEDVERALRLLEGAESRLAEISSSATGVLRIGASETIFQYMLSETIVEYNRLYPNVRIELISGFSPKIAEYMRNDKCDIGFLNLSDKTEGNIEIVGVIRYLHDIFVAGNAFSRLKGIRMRAEELREYPLLVMERGTVAREAFDNYTAGRGVSLIPSVEINNWGYMKQLVVDGMGIGCIPREYALNKLASGLLFELCIEPEMPARAVVMALPENHANSFAVRAFIKLFDASCGSVQDEPRRQGGSPR